MKTIFSSYADCTKCGLWGNSSAILDTNVDNLSEAEIVFIGINPGKVEARLDRPFTGSTATYLRRRGKRILDTYTWVFTNIALCTTISRGKTETPGEDMINLCKANVIHLLQHIQPKLVVLCGREPLDALTYQIYRTMKMTALCGQFVNLAKPLEHRCAMALFHPRYPKQNGGASERLFLDSLERIYNYVDTVRQFNEPLADPFYVKDFLTGFVRCKTDTYEGTHRAG